MAPREGSFESRAVDVDLEPSRDGRTLDGYVAVFNSRSRIPDRNGDFEEEIKPGAFDRSLRDNGVPILQWDHGRDPRVGTVPIGRWDEWNRDHKGYRVRGHLFDNAVVEPVRQAIASGAVTGLSFRFQVTKNGDRWERRSGGMDLRHVMDCDVAEAGPVAFPAYKDAKVSLRHLGAVESVERHYEEHAPQTLAEVMALVESVSGLSERRVQDRIDVVRERKALDRKAQIGEIRDLATAYRRTVRKRDLEYAMWRHGWGGVRSLDGYVAADREAREVRAELLEACCMDESLVAAAIARVVL